MEPAVGKMKPNSGAELTENEQKLIEFIKKKPKGVTMSEISQEFSDLEKKEQAIIINKLSSTSRITFVTRGKNQLILLNNAVVGSSLKGSDNEEKVVYAIIQQGGNKGVWVRDIRKQCQLYDTKLDKVLKSLDSKKLIKEIKSIAAGGKKKLYMLYNLEPHRSVTGGAFYQGRDFETEYVDILTQQSHLFLTKKREEAEKLDIGPLALRKMSYVSHKEVAKYISDLNVSKVELSEVEVISLLNSLYYDGKVDRSVNGHGDIIYGAIPYLIPTPGLMKTPCGFCPVRRNCNDLGDVTPLKCSYFNEWLDMGS
ncbi:RNA polymerase III subunit F [Cotesia typhae]